MGLLTDGELEALRPAQSKHMLVKGFVQMDEIPTIAFDKPMYVGAESKKNGGEGQPFVLLRESMIKSGKVAVGQWVARSAERVRVLISHKKGFLLKPCFMRSKSGR